MMECEPSLTYNRYAIKQEEPATLGWPLGVSDLSQLEPFTADSTTGVYPQSLDIKTEYGAPYANQQGLGEFGWQLMNGMDGAQTFNTVGQHTTTSQSQSQPGTDITIPLAAPDAGFGNTVLQGGSYEVNGLSALSMGYQADDPDVLVSPHVWQQQQFPQTDPNGFDNMAPLSNPKGAMSLHESTLYNAEATMSGYVPPGLGVQGLSVVIEPPEPLPSGNSPQAWQNDESLRMGYAPVPANPVLQNLLHLQAMTETTNPGMASYCGPVTTTTTQVQLTLDDTVKEFFTPEELGLTPNAPAFTLSANSDDGHISQYSREVSVTGSWGSPRTPYQWDARVAPSPVNGPGIIVSKTRAEDLPNGHLEVTTTVQINPGHPCMEQITGNADSSPKRQSSNRKRKAYSMEGRQKVNSVRESGACFSCHARKVPCSKDGSCEPCLKVAGDPIMAREICLREKLKDSFIGVKVIHEKLDDRKAGLQPLLASLIGEPKVVDLKVANIRQGYSFQLSLKVMTCSSSPRCRWKRLTKVNGIYVTQDVIQDQRYVIVPESLPTIDQFDAFGRKILSFANGSHSGNLTRHLDDFLLGYCQGTHALELKGLANATLRIASLNRLVAYGFLNLYDGSYDLLDRETGSPITENKLARRYVSETVHDQLRILAAEGLEPIEVIVFSKLDNLNKIMAKVPNGRLLVGVCILRLVLLYRDRVIRDSIRLGLPRSGDQHRVRMQKAAFMYRRLTIVYAALCRESTPLSMTWLPEGEDEANPSPQDQALVESFSKLQPAFVQFCTERLTPEHDDLFQKLIVDGPKIERRPTKKAKAKSRSRACTT